MGNVGTRQSTTIDEQVKEHCIVVYSTTVCSFCTKTKHLLDEMNVEYGVVELNEMSPSAGGHLIAELRDKTKMNTVPQIFINGEFIGGYNEISLLKNAGVLYERLAKCSKPCIK